jgi:hypothetical protein
MLTRKDKHFSHSKTGGNLQTQATNIDQSRSNTGLSSLQIYFKIFSICLLLAVVIVRSVLILLILFAWSKSLKG